MKRYAILAALMMAIWLTGCGTKNAAEIPEPQYYSLRFWMGDTLLFTQDAPKGALPSVTPSDVPSGIRFLGWEEDYETVQGPQDYHGIFVPELKQHVPFLFPREDGFLCPDSPFTADDLCLALHALADETARPYFPTLPQGQAGLTASVLSETLSVFFPSLDVLSDYEGDIVLTRGQAAQIFCSLLGRQDEGVSVSGDIPSFPDLSPARADYASCMEAAVSHEEGETPWSDFAPEGDWTPGWHIRKGKAYYLDESGVCSRNKIIEGNLLLDADGFQTSGNAQLDTYVTDLLAGFQEENPEADRMTLLHIAYLYVRDSFFYLRKDNLDFGALGWETGSALEMFRTGKGNCYNYAAAFSALAKGLGYSAEAVSGTIGESWDPHGWAEITLDGAVYYCDPESEMVELSWGNDWNFFMLSLSTGSNFHYRCPRNT